MSINFEFGTYRTLVHETENIKWGHKATYRWVHPQALQFQYGSITFEQFESRHGYRYIDCCDCLLVPIIALPMAAYCLVAKTTYHLALLAFDALTEAFSRLLCAGNDSNYGSYLLAHTFYIARDFQEAFGWLTSIFNLTYANYQIQESSFQKSCYDCFFVDERSYDREGCDIRRANQYFAEGNLADALEIAQCYAYDREFDPELCEKIAIAYCAKHDFDAALRAGGCLFDDLQRDNVYKKIALACLDVDNPNKALEIMGKLTYYSTYQEKNELSGKIALTYLRMNQIDKALEIIDHRILYDGTQQNILKGKVIKEFLNRRDRVQATRVIDNLLDVNHKNSWLVQVALSYHADQYNEQVQATIAKILTNSFKSRYPTYQTIYTRYASEVAELFSRLAIDCYDQLKAAFATCDEKGILEGIESMACKASTLTAFLEIEPKPQPKAESKGSGYYDDDFFHGFGSSRSSGFGFNYNADDFFRHCFARGFTFGFGSSFSGRGFSGAPQEGYSSQDEYSAPANAPTVSISSQYAILGLPDGATKDQVKKAFRTFSTTNHPDKVPESERAAAEERFKVVSNAYEALRIHLNF